MTSVFNPEEFLNGTVEAGFSTKRPLVPEAEYLMQLAEGKIGLDVKAAETKNGTRYILSLNWELLSEEAKAATGMDKPRVKQDIWLDLDEHGRLKRDKTDNIQLGQLLSGLGLNSGTFSWPQVRNVGVCKGKVVLGKPNDKGEQFNEVRSIVKYNGG